MTRAVHPIPHPVSLAHCLPWIRESVPGRSIAPYHTICYLHVISDCTVCIMQHSDSHGSFKLEHHPSERGSQSVVAPDFNFSPPSSTASSLSFHHDHLDSARAGDVFSSCTSPLPFPSHDDFSLEPHLFHDTGHPDDSTAGEPSYPQWPSSSDSSFSSPYPSLSGHPPSQPQHPFSSQSVRSYNAFPDFDSAHPHRLHSGSPSPISFSPAPSQWTSGGSSVSASSVSPISDSTAEEDLPPISQQLDDVASMVSSQRADRPIESGQKSSAGPVKRRRQRAPAGLSAEQRAQLRRRQHRNIDAQRRQREQTAIQRLEQLIDEPLTHLLGNKRRGVEADFIDGGAEEEEGEGQDNRDYGEDVTRKGKASILERTAHQMEEMRRRISELTELYKGEQTTNRQLFSHLQTSNSRSTFSASTPSSTSSTAVLPAPLSGMVNYHMATQSIYSSSFLSASVGMYYILAQTGVMLDLNSRCLEMTGWKREHVVNRLLTAPYHWIMMPESKDVKDEVAKLDGTRYLVEDTEGKVAAVKGQRQYDKTVRLQKELYRGEQSQVTLVWRVLLRNRRLHEVTVSQWIGSTMDVDDGKGGVTQRPLYVVGLVKKIQCMD